MKGEPDCPNRDDEKMPNCQNITCRADQFQCKDKSCIPGHFHCSGNAECSDGSDELNCSKLFVSLIIQTCLLTPRKYSSSSSDSLRHKNPV